MDEKRLKRQLARGTVLVAAASVVLCAAVFGILTYLYRSAHASEHKQMQVETGEYKARIMKQIDKNFQILATLSKVYELEGGTGSMEAMGESLEAVNQENSFVSLSYFTADGRGVRNIPTAGTLEMPLADCDEKVQNAVGQAMKGERAVSKMYDNRFFGEKTISYAVPVYQDGQVVGVIAASDTLEIFQDVAGGQSVMGGTGYIHVLANDGEFLARSENTIVTERMRTIFDGGALSEETKTAVRAAMAGRESLYGDLRQNGQHYHFYMEPLDYNGWYLFCANVYWRSPLSLGRVILIVACVFGAVLALMLLLLHSGYREFRDNARALLRLAYHDRLTGAFNTEKFDQEFQAAVKNQAGFAVAACNLHNFRGINDLFGRDQGDRALVYVKGVIEKSLKPGEFFCRDTGDLFFLFLLETQEAAIRRRLETVAETIRHDSLYHRDYSYEMSPYFGVALGEDREKALVALQSIQNAHDTNLVFCNEGHLETVRRKYILESQMNPALQNQEFQLYLQPKFDLKTNALAGAEALVRWQAADGTFRCPGEFIPLFEANGFCVNLDMYMLERVCQQLRAWMDAGIRPIPISVNQSKRLFSDNNYPEAIAQLAARYGVPTSLITLEILEGTGAGDLNHLNAQISALHQKGFRVSMDDFGSGYSSLNMLYALRIDEVKLDRGFLRQVFREEDNARRLVMLEQIVSFAKSLGMTTVAEGIETEADARAMALLACDYGQGYFYQRPISAGDFHETYMTRP